MVKDGITTVLASNITYRADGLPKSLTYGNGLTETRTHDQRGQLTNQVLGSETRDYSYDLNGNLTQAIRANGTSLYAYDALDRLTQETSAAVGNLGYGYDPNGNRLSFLDNGETKNYAYSQNSNRLMQIGHKDVVLDAAGNTVSDQNGKRRFEYLASGRLFKVYKEKKWVATYLYNHLGQRTQKVTKRGTTIYHYDLNGHLIAETTAHGDLIRAYVWLDNLPLVQIDVKGKENEHRRKPRKEHIAYLHTDHLGTPRLATDANQQVVWRWESDAFGAKKPDDNDEYDSDDDNKITVNLGPEGTYRDRETQLTYNWARYVDKHGRFITTDPVSVEEHVQRWRATLGIPNQLPLELNPFVRVANNPLRWVDPTGEATSPPICNGPDCVHPPYDPTPDGPKPSPQPKPEKPRRPGTDCTKQPTFHACMSCCSTISGQIGTTGAVGSTCAEACMRKEGITRNDQQQCSVTTRN